MIILNKKINFQHIKHNFEDLEKIKISKSLDDTKVIGRNIGSNISNGDVILLSGDLGAGKTELVRYIVEGSGNNSFVRSPTFVLINNYIDKNNITHCDFYRINSNTEANELGIEEYYDSSTVIIEWPEKIIQNLPEDVIIIKIYFTDIENERKFMLYSTGIKSKTFIGKLK